ncbi:MAG TPA: DUF4129 domain-containing protein, partial [Abditibacteriaceae bacterium]
RTNWEHLGALRGAATTAPLVAPLAELTRRFDRVRYGNARCSQADWQIFESDVSAVEQKIKALPSDVKTEAKAGARS